MTNEHSLPDALRLAEDDDALFAACAPLGIARWRLVADESGRVTSVQWSQELARMLGVDAAKLSSPEALASLVHPEDAPRQRGALHRALADPSQPFDETCRIQTRRGWRWFRTTGRYVEGAAGPGQPFYGITVDVDDLHRAADECVQQSKALAAAAQEEEREIEALADLRRRRLETADRLQQLTADLAASRHAIDEQLLSLAGLAQACDTVWRVRAADSSFELCWNNMAYGDQNPVSKALASVRYGEAISRYAAAFVHPEDLAAFRRTTDPAQLAAALADAPAVRLRYRKKTGTHYEISLLRLEDGSGDFIIAFRDVEHEVQEEKQAAEALQAALESVARADRAKTVFLNSVSHDIRTPMNGILGLTDAALRHAGDPAKVEDCLAKIGAASRHLISLVNDVIDVSSIESGRISFAESPFRVTEAFSAAVGLVAPEARQRGLDLTTFVTSVVHEDVTGDALRLRQVFVNLLGNAVKFTPQGGAVTVTLAEKPSDSRHYATFVFTCRDTGCGMSPDFLEKLFIPYERSEESRRLGIQGTGLGLSITRTLVTLMDGDIKVESAPGRGSTFTVSFRLKRSSETPSVNPALQGLPVLAVGRLNDTGRAIETLLTEMGLACDLVGNVEDACRLLREKTYRAVLVGRSVAGTEPFCDPAALQAAAATPVPLILVGSHEFTPLEENARQLGFFTCVTKPLYRSKLEALLQTVVEGRSEEAKTRSVLESYSRTDFSAHRILLVEDNALNREILLEILKMTKVQTDVATNGAEALECYRSHPAGTYDLVLMDIQMPVMDGLAASRAIRSSGREDAATIPIVALTANAFSEDRATALASGMNDYLAKPVNLEALLGVMRRHLKDPA